MYNEVFPCIFEPKSKVPVESKSVYQLLSTMRIRKKDDVLKFKATEKTHATLRSKKRFPMFIDHMTRRAGWKVNNNIHHYYTFEKEHFKKDYILGNQKAIQAAVARGDDVQADFWKLLNNANFGFDYRDNLQNKSLHLMYDENAEVEFISKYGSYNSDNCFQNLDARLKNINKYYNDADNLEKDEVPYADTLREEKIERVNKKKKDRKGKNKVLSHEGLLEKAYSNKAYTFVQDLEKEVVNSVKGVACKKQTTIRVSTRYILSKLLINAKISFASFIYDCIDNFASRARKLPSFALATRSSRYYRIF